MLQYKGVTRYTNIGLRGEGEMRKTTKWKKGVVKNVRSVAGLGLFILLSSLFNSHQAIGSETGPLTTHPTNPRYFADGTGKAIYLTGSHSWYFFQDWGTSGGGPLVFDELVNLLKTNHHNFVRGWVCKSTRIPWGSIITVETQVYERTGPGTAWDGGLKFDLNEFNEEYFTRLRERAIILGENGIYLSMMMFWDTARKDRLCRSGRNHCLHTSPALRTRHHLATNQPERQSLRD